MKISDYSKAQGWLKRHASSENSVGEWEKYVALNTTPELDVAIKTINDKYGPGTMFPASEAPIPPMTDQQAIFEWEERNKKAGGGRIGFEDGLKVKGKFPKKEGFVWDRKEKVFRKSIKGKKGKNFEQWLLDQIEADNTEFKTAQDVFEAAGEKSHGSNQKIWNKYKDKFKITSGSRLGGNISLKNEKILEFFNKQEPGSKINVERAVKEINKNLPKDQQISESIITNRLKDTKFNTTFLGSQTLGEYHGELSDAMKHNIIAKFGDDLGITMEDFEKKGKYGVNATEVGLNKYQAIRNAVSDKNTAWNRAYNLGAADGWLLESYRRAGYKPLTEIIGDRERIVGYEAPDGTKWFGGKKWADKYNGKHVKTTHPSYDRVNKLVTVVSETRVAPNDAIIDMLKKGSGVKNIDGITLESLTSYLLDNNADVKNIKKGLSTYHKHHVKGVKIVPDDDIQLVTRVANTEARKAMNEIELLKKNNQPIDYDALDKRLKNYGVSVEVDGKRLGGSGFESKADIEKFVTKKIGAWEKSDFEKFANNMEDYITGKSNKRPTFGSGPVLIWEQLMDEPMMKALTKSAQFKKFANFARGTTKYFGPIDLLIGFVDYENELSKYKKADGTYMEGAEKAARKQALQTMSFGLWRGGDEEKIARIKETFIASGGDGNVFDAAVAINENQNKINNAMDSAKENYLKNKETEKEFGVPGGAQAIKFNLDMPTAVQQMDSDVANIKRLATNHIDLTNQYVDVMGKDITVEQFKEPFSAIKQAGLDTAKKRWQENYKSIYDKPTGTLGTGDIGEFFKTSIFTTTPRQREEEKRLIEDMKAFNPSELYRYNKEFRNLTRDNPEANVELLMGEILSKPSIYGRHQDFEFKSTGGIAGVKKVDPDELKEAQEKMKKLMKQYKNKNLDWDAVKRSYRIWTK